MPDPKKYKNTEPDYKRYMQNCMHTTLHKEKKEQDQGVAICLNMWRKEHGDKHPGRAPTEASLKTLAAAVRDWVIEVKEISDLSDKLKEAMKTKDEKKILDAQLNLVDHYAKKSGRPTSEARADLIHNIREICPDRVKEIIHGESPLDSKTALIPGKYTVVDLDLDLNKRRHNNCGHEHKDIKDAEKCLKGMKDFDPKGKFAIVDSKTFEPVTEAK